MNKYGFDLLSEIRESGEKNQRYLSNKLGISLGKVNVLMKDLVEEGLLTKDFQVSKTSESLAKESKPQKAIILAAGYGMRMVPINLEIPKGLLEIQGETLIERLIRQLKEVGVDEIDVVVGFLKEKYEYLIDKWGVQLIYNGEYGKKNNLHSLNKALKDCKNTYILPCDLWCKENPFLKEEWYSWYLMGEEKDEDSVVRLGRKKDLLLDKKKDSGNRMIGIAYFLKKDMSILKDRVSTLSQKREHKDSFWEEALFQENKSWISGKLVKKDKIFEINTFEQLRDIEKDSSHLKSEILEEISRVLSCNIEEIQEVKALKKGMTNRSFQFTCKNRRYIARIPGEGSENLINRAEEYEVYQALRGQKISDVVLSISPHTGYKISEYLEDARTCNSRDKKEVKECMNVLRKFHEKQLKVTHSFDVFQKILEYETLRGETPSDYQDYEETKANILELKTFLDKEEKFWTLSHIDAIPDNFLRSENQIYLIDWEYAGMQDGHMDIAMFGVYSFYSKEEMDWLMDTYFRGKTPERIRVKIYCYIAICGFLWSNWCEYKKSLGIEFGEYSLRQYRYAKEYYRYAKQEMEKL